MKVDEWDNDKNKLKNRTSEVDGAIEQKISNIEGRLYNLEEEKTWKQRQERKNSIIIKYVEQNQVNVRGDVLQEVNKIFESMEAEAEYEQVRDIGRDWQRRNMILVKMKNFDEKLRITRNKRKLAGKGCYIENDMTKEERQTQAAIHRMAREERAKGHTIKIGFQKIQINGKWEYLNGEKTKTTRQASH
jgi:hypothetical protein